MNVNPTPLSSESAGTPRNLLWFWISALAALLFTVSELAALLRTGHPEMAWALAPVFVAALVSLLLARQGRPAVAAFLFIAAIGLQVVLTTSMLSGIGVSNAIIAFVLTIGISMAALPRKRIVQALLIGLAVSMLSISIDLFGSPERPVSSLESGRWTFTAIMVLFFLVFFVRELRALDIRTKIVMGILGTGGLALGILVLFSLSVVNQIAGALSARLETSVSELGEEQLINTALLEADRAAESFARVEEQVAALAGDWAALQQRPGTLNLGSHWDAERELVQLEGGQYGNSQSDVSSVFVPVKIPLDQDLITELNLSAYLDFFAPKILEDNPSLLAIYAIDTRGVTRYYPNIGLASLVPPDFDTTQRPYYAIVSPLFNPERQPRWTIPYVDATGGGLVVTVAAPVYRGERFNGIVAADMQLTQITAQVGQIQIGRTGYAFLLDDAGRILSMPPAGYAMFGIDPEQLGGEEFFKQTVLGKGSSELQAVTRRMAAGGKGLLTIDVAGIDTYISFAPIQTNGYSIALVVPVAELQGTFTQARNQTQQQIRSASQVVGVLLMVLLLVAILVSMGLGQIIAGPIQRLTQVASQIAGGDLSVYVTHRAEDEIGTLANAFNVMTARLRETLDGLEHKVQERTTDLMVANERNERRATQFESIAQVARTISSTADLELLLPVITNEISRTFGFYHVGIFLLDASRQYAVLRAANSEGGRAMLANGHRLKVGETGMVGHVTDTGQPRVALDTGAEAIFFNNPYLPDTRSEITLPLRAGGEIIGALDVQSTQANAFTQEDINILSTLAEQVSIAIQSAQQFEQTRKALSEAEALAKQFVREGWRQFTSSKKLAGLQRTGTRSRLLYGHNGKDHEENGWGELSARRKPRGASLSLPIKLRGEVIGSVDVQSQDSRPWDQDELDIVSAILERTAIAMENARLLEESRRLASKESKIGEVTAKISSSINMRNVLQTAVEELGRALPGSEVVIQFQPENNQDKTGS